jgi:hypothetical protein
MDRRSSPGRVKNSLFSTSSRQVLGSTQPYIRWIPGVTCPEVKRQGRESDRSPPYSQFTSTEQVHTTQICIHVFLVRGGIGSNLSQDTSYFDWGLSWFHSVSSGKFWHELNWIYYLQSASELYRPSDRRLLTKLVLIFADRRWAWSVQRIPTAVNVSFLDPELLDSIQVARQLYSRGWVSSGNRARELWPLDHRGGLLTNIGSLRTIHYMDKATIFQTMHVNFEV